jgi:hypothetical protein
MLLISPVIGSMLAMEKKGPFIVLLPCSPAPMLPYSAFSSLKVLHCAKSPDSFRQLQSMSHRAMLNRTRNCMRETRFTGKLGEE